MVTVFDPALAIPLVYQSWVAPELFPGYPPARMKNWHIEDLEAYVGGYYLKGEDNGGI